MLGGGGEIQIVYIRVWISFYLLFILSSFKVKLPVCFIFFSQQFC